jgi:hypothetical protein
MFAQISFGFTKPLLNAIKLPLVTVDTVCEREFIDTNKPIKSAIFLAILIKFRLNYILVEVKST